MFNLAPYNQNIYNGGQPGGEDLIFDDIIFNGFGLQNAKVCTSFKDDDNLPDIDLNISANPILDGGVVLNRKYPSKIINIEGSISASDSAGLLELMDNLKFFTSEVEGFLDIKKADGSYRRTRATCNYSKIFDKNNYNIDRVKFKMQFKTVEPFSYLRDTVSLSEFSLSSDITYDVPYLGTATGQPVIYLIFSSASGTNEIEVQKGSNTILINESINAGDVVIVDSDGKAVTINGIEVDYDGTFFDIERGANIIDISVNGTYVYDLTILHKQQYL